MPVETFPGPSALFFFGLLLVAVVGIGGWWLQHKRRERLAQWAAANGWLYVDSDPTLVRLSERYPFGDGHARRTGEVMRGRFGGAEALSFAYSWKTGSGKSESSHTVHVIGLALPAYLPIVEVAPENVFDKMAKAFGGQDIRFELEEFNRAFRVQAYDERTAHAVIHPRLMERLLRADARGLSWRTEGTWILSWQAGATDLDTMASRFGVLSAVVAAIPRHVWQDHGFDPLAPPAR